MRDCYLRYSAALMKFFAFVEDQLKRKGHGLDEYTAAQKLEEIRKQDKLYLGPSFPSISGIGPNGAVIHYKPEKETALPLNNDEIYLLDSGG